MTKLSQKDIIEYTSKLKTTPNYNGNGQTIGHKLISEPTLTSVIANGVVILIPRATGGEAQIEQSK